ncbi:hypothetical protein CCP3SC15_60022 [Gammaproteobacteria bacterium]
MSAIFPRFFLGLIFLLVGSVAHALDVEGRAPLASSDHSRARVLALEDALNRVQPPPGPNGYTVIGEWAEGDTLILRIRIGPGDIHPRLALAQFHLIHPGKTEGGILAEALVGKLAERLQGGGQVVVTDPGHYQLILPSDLSPLSILYDGTSVRRLAAVTTAELVFSGVLWDISQQEEDVLFPWQKASTQYHLDLEVFLHDGITGVLLDRRRTTVKFVGLDGMTDLVKDLAVWAEMATVKRPLIASILRVKGDLLFLDLSAASGLKSGMSIMIAPFDPLLLAPDRTNSATLLAPTGPVVSATVIEAKDTETTVKVPGSHLVPGERVLIRSAPLSPPVDGL